MAFCTFCGAELKSDSVFCTTCGRSLAAEQTADFDAVLSEGDAQTTEPVEAATQPVVASPSDGTARASSVNPSAQSGGSTQQATGQAEGSAQPRQTQPPINRVSPPQYQPFQQPFATYNPQTNHGMITTGGWIGILLLTAIPVVGFVMLIIWAAGGCTKRQKTYYARALLIVSLIVLLISVLAIIVGFIVMRSMGYSHFPFHWNVFGNFDVVFPRLAEIGGFINGILL